MNGAANRADPAGTAPARELSPIWAQPRFKSGILWGAGFLFAILSLAAVVVVSHESGMQLREATRAVTQTRDILDALGAIATRLSEVESAARSFAISGKQSHLAPFYTAARAVPPQVDKLKLLVRNHPALLRSVTEIEPVIARHLKVMKDMVELGDKNLFRGHSQRSLTDEGNSLMEQIQVAFSAMEK